jgi:hypothetical protein
MKNRAKCKLCGDVIESKHRNDYVTCSCGEITIDGGNDYFKASAINWENFLRIDDEGNEIIVTVIEKESTKELSKEVVQPKKPTKKEIIDVLEEMVKNIEGLPQHAMLTPINHYDFNSFLVLIVEVLRADCKESN